MSKRVNRYRSGIKNPHLEVHLDKEDDRITVTVIDWRTGKTAKLVREPPSPPGGKVPETTRGSEGEQPSPSPS